MLFTINVMVVMQYIGYFIDDNWLVNVLAEDEAHARKIGVDYIMQAKYMEQEADHEHE